MFIFYFFKEDQLNEVKSTTVGCIMLDTIQKQINQFAFALLMHKLCIKILNMINHIILNQSFTKYYVCSIMSFKIRILLNLRWG